MNADGIGAAVRSARAKAGLSGRSLAALAGVSQSFLSNVENGRVTPSVPSLYAISEALGVGPAELLPEMHDAARTMRAGHVEPFPATDPGTVPQVILELLTGARGQIIEAYRIRQEAGFADTKSYGHPGEDLIYIIEGKVTLERRDKRFRLKAGDIAWLDAMTPHSFTTPRDSGVVALLVSIR